MPAPYQPADRAKELEEAGNHSCTLDGHLFWLAPRTFSATAQRVQVSQPTYGDVIRFAYTMQPLQIQFQGWTGNGGLEELRAIRQLMPAFGKKDQPHTFIYDLFDLRVQLYIDVFSQTNDQTFPYYLQYTVQGQVYPPPGPAYVSLQTATAASPGGGSGALTS